MDDVLHVRGVPCATQVAADGARGSGCRIGGAHHGAHTFDDALAFNNDGNQRTRTHEIKKPFKERLTRVVTVVLCEDFARGNHDLQALDDVALGFNAAQDLTGQTAGITVWLDEDEGVFQRGIQ